MPARRDLTGVTFGTLIVLGQGAVATGKRRSWRVRCDCGREEEYAQRRLTEPRRPDKVSACSVCAASTCVVCSTSLGARTTRRTCDTCRLAHKRSIYRAYNHRAAASPEWRAKALARARDKRAADPTSARTRERIARARRLEDPTQVAQLRDTARRHYARHAPEIQARRRAVVAAMTDEQFAVHRARCRQAVKESAARKRTAADAETHEAYLDAQAEYRRRRALAAAMAEAAQLPTGDAR